ncbi:putative transmembrane protein, partial [Toxoplasma gondii FOU]
FVYAVFDNTWHLIAEPGSRHVNPLTIIPASPSLEIAAVQTVYILAVRTPTINLIFLLYIITYIIIFFVALPPGVQQVQLFTISMAGWLFTCVGGQLFYTR